MLDVVGTPAGRSAQRDGLPIRVTASSETDCRSVRQRQPDGRRSGRQRPARQAADQADTIEGPLRVEGAFDAVAREVSTAKGAGVHLPGACKGGGGWAPGVGRIPFCSLG